MATDHHGADDDAIDDPVDGPIDDPVERSPDDPIDDLADDQVIPTTVRRVGAEFVVEVGADEAAMLRRLLGELREMLTVDDPGDAAEALLVRLFPVAYPDDDDMEAEYQRLMREELVASKLASFDVVDRALDGERLDESQLVAVMQSVNSIRLVLGVMLDVSDDPDDDEVDERLEQSPEYALYAYLSYLLEITVEAASD